MRTEFPAIATAFLLASIPGAAHPPAEARKPRQIAVLGLRPDNP